MTRDNSKARGHHTRRTHLTRRAGGNRRTASRLRASCVTLCCALALQPSLIMPGRGVARAAGRAAAGAASSPAAVASRSLLAAVTTIADGIRQLVPVRTAGARAPAVRAAAYEPGPAAVFLSAPTGLFVDATSDAQVSISWAAVPGAAGYRVERSPNVLTPFQTASDVGAAPFQDGGVSRGNTYLYRVRAVDASGVVSPPSAVMMATAVSFTDPELVGANDPQGRRATVIRAAHVNDLRAAVDGVRRAACLPAASWGEPVTPGTPFWAAFVRDLRSKLDEALAALGLPVTAYADQTLLTGPNGTRVKKVHFDQLRERSTRGAGVAASGLAAHDFASARLDASNRTGTGGVDLVSRNFNWSLPLVNLPGRSGLDLSLALSYNSLVWTRSGDSVLFDGDGGWPAPGFRLGFAVVQGKFYDAQAQREAYMLVTPAGARVSLRRTVAAGVYEAGDSSYLQLVENADGSLTLVAPGGTRMSYRWLGGAYRCTEVKDANGNYLSAAYNGYGNLEAITDTVGRVLSFGYYGDGYLKEITQVWHREVETNNTIQTVTETHPWARFYYDDQVVRTNFQGLTPFGPANGQTFRALTKVELADNSSYTFGYTTWGQVNVVANHARDGRLLNCVSLDLPANEAQPQSDCPRFEHSRVWAAHWNGDEDGTSATGEEAVTSYGAYNFAGGVGRAEAPDGTLHKETYETAGWKKGLTVRADEYDASDHEHPKKWTLLTWTQDGESLGYEQNPRVAETNVYDAEGNRRRTTVGYTFRGLPEDVREYDADGATVLRRTHTEYVASSVDGNGAYVARRITGLPEKREVYGREGGEEKLFSKVTFEYDLGGEFLTAPEGNPASVAQHDPSYIGVGFNVRGNLSRVRRWDVTAPDNQTLSAASETGYSTLGAAVFMRDTSGHKTAVSYTDTDGGGRLVYPTKVTDPDGFTSSTSYNYDTGAVTKTERPKPNETTDQPGPEVVRLYDAAGRPLLVRSLADGAYTRWEYGTSGLYVKQYAKVDADKPETFVMSVVDGAGRVRGSLRELPGGYAAQRFAYDAVGRQTARSNPVEVTVGANDAADVSQWQPAGDDAATNGGAGWAYTSQSYDWKGRPAVTTNTDNTQRRAEYGGCGCAGGEVVTLTDEAGRRRKVYSDALGRRWKAEVLNADGTVYTTATTSYDALDRETVVRRYQGTEQGGVYQEATRAYDGHGRLKESHAPGQDAGRFTKYIYKADDTLESVTDARGVKAVYGYGNNRHLVSSVSYDLTGVIANQNVQATPGASFQYDAAGNRTGMTDGVGTVSYDYDALSRLTSETRQFTGLSYSYTLTYSYNLAGQVEGVKDSSNSGSWQGAEVSYAYSTAGGVTGVKVKNGGTEQPLASGIMYRAWGAVKAVSYGNGAQLSAQYDGRMNLTRYELSGVHVGGSQAAVTLGSQSQYYADGRVRYAQDLQDDRFDRAYGYDHMGRLKEAYSGREARGLAALSVPDSPLRQSYTYDAWDNMGRVGRTWTNGFADAPAYHNDRRDGWDYDADGRETAGGTAFVVTQEKYDAAGRHARHFEESDANGLVEQDTIELAYGGDDLAGRRVEARYSSAWAPQTQATTLYYLRSSVLGGKVIAEVDATGGKRKGEVYLGGEELAEQQFGGAGSGGVVWKHHDPARSSLVESAAGGNATRRELDPLGQEVGAADPYALYGGSYGRMAGGDSLYAETGNPFNPANGCALDGIGVSCSLLRDAMEAGAVANETVIHHPNGTRQVIQDLFRDEGLGLFSTYTYRTGRGHEVEPEKLFLYLPQKSETRRLTNTELSAVRKELERLLTDTCTAFIDKLVSFNTGESFSSKDKLLDWLDRTAKAPEGGIFFAPGDGGSARNKFGDYARINVGLAPLPNILPSALPAHYRSSATTLLHELIHSLTHGSDDQLSRDVRDLEIVPIGRYGKPMDFPPEGSDIYAYSAYWGTALKNACHPDL